MSSAAEPLARDVVRDPSAGLGAVLDRFAGDMGARYAGLGGPAIGENGTLTAALNARWSLPMGNGGLEVHAAADLAALVRDWGTYAGYDDAAFDFSAPFVRPVDPAAHPTGLSAEQVGHTRGPSRSLVSPAGARPSQTRPRPLEQWRAAADGRLSPYPASMGTPGGIAPSLLRFPDARGALTAPAVQAPRAGSAIRAAGLAPAARTVLVSDGPGRAWGGHSGAATAATAAERMADGVAARHADTQANRPSLWLVPRNTTGAERRRLAEVGAVRRGTTAGLDAALALNDRLGDRIRPAEASAFGFGPGDVGTLVQPRLAAAVAAAEVQAQAAPAAGRRASAVLPTPTARAATQRPRASTKALALAAPITNLKPETQFVPANLRALGETPAFDAPAAAAPWQVPGSVALKAAWQAMGRRATEVGPTTTMRGGSLALSAAQRAAETFDIGAPGTLVQPRPGATQPASPAAAGMPAAPQRSRSAAKTVASAAAAAPGNAILRAMSRGPGAAADPVGAGAPLGHRVAARALAHATEGVGALMAAMPAAREFGAADPEHSGGIVSALMTRLATAEQAAARGLRAQRGAHPAEAGFTFSGPLDAEWVRTVAASQPAGSTVPRSVDRGGAPPGAPVAGQAPATARSGPPASVRVTTAAVEKWLPLLADAGRNAGRPVAGAASTQAPRTKVSPTAPGPSGAPGTSGPTTLGAGVDAAFADAPMSRAVSLRAGLATAPLATEAFAARLNAERFESPSVLLAAEASTAMDLAFMAPPGTLVVPFRWTAAGAQLEPGVTASPAQTRRARASATSSILAASSGVPGASPGVAASAAAMPRAPSAVQNIVAGQSAQASGATGRGRSLPGGLDAVVAATPLRPAPAGRTARSAAHFAARRLGSTEASGRGSERQRSGVGRGFETFAAFGAEIPGAVVSANQAQLDASAGRNAGIGRNAGVGHDLAAIVTSGAPRLTGATSLTSGLLAAFAEADRGRLTPLAAEARAAAAEQAQRASGRWRSESADAPGALISAATSRTTQIQTQTQLAAERASTQVVRKATSARPGLTAATATALAERLTQARSRVFEAAARAVSARSPSIAAASATSGRAAAVQARGAVRAASVPGELPGAVVAPSTARLDRPAGQAGVVAPSGARRAPAGSGLNDARSLVSRLLGPEVGNADASPQVGFDGSPGALVAAAAVHNRGGARAAAAESAASSGAGREGAGGRRSPRLGYAPGNVGRALVAFNRAARVEAVRGGVSGVAALASGLGVDPALFGSAGELLTAAVDAAPRPASSMARRAEPPRVRTSMRLPGSLFADRGPSISLGGHDGGSARVMVDTGARAAEAALRSTPGHRPERKAETNEEARHRNAEQSEDSLSPEEVERIARDVIARLEEEAEADRELFGEDFD